MDLTVTKEYLLSNRSKWINVKKLAFTRFKKLEEKDFDSNYLFSVKTLEGLEVVTYEEYVNLDGEIYLATNSYSSGLKYKPYINILGKEYILDSWIMRGKDTIEELGYTLYNNKYGIYKKNKIVSALNIEFNGNVIIGKKTIPVKRGDVLAIYNLDNMDVNVISGNSFGILYEKLK